MQLRSQRITANPSNGLRHNVIRPTKFPRAACDSNYRFRRDSVQPANEQRADFVIGLDLGTTNTSSLFACKTNNWERCMAIRDFPSDPQPHIGSGQVPTEICYLKPIIGGQWEIKSGYEIESFLRDAELVAMYHEPIHLQQIKLLFDVSEERKSIREQLIKKMRPLLDEGRLEHPEDCMYDFLTQLFSVYKSYLSDFRYAGNSTVELGIGVPNSWRHMELARLEKCVRKAMDTARFGIPTGTQKSRIRFVAEAEAAAISVLQHNIYDTPQNEAILLVDCGGGTLDIILLRVTNQRPLRIVELFNRGYSVGGCEINNRLQDFLEKVLRQCPDFDYPKDKITMFVWKLIQDKFERREKQLFKYVDEYKYSLDDSIFKKSRKYPRFANGSIALSQEDMVDFFDPTIKEILDRTRDALVDSRNEGYQVSKLVLTGGLGGSLTLKGEIKRLLYEEGFSPRVQLVRPLESHNSGTDVAQGAVERILDPSVGPERRLQTSLGFSRKVLVSDLSGERAHQPSKMSEFDGQPEVHDTIQWILKKGTKVVSRSHPASFFSSYCFLSLDQPWIAEEELFISETCTEDYWQIDHPKNKGKVLSQGEITCNLDPLKASLSVPGAARPKGEKDTYYYARKQVQGGVETLYYEVHIKIVLALAGMNLDIDVWPVDEFGKEIRNIGALNESGRSFSIAAAFAPGTS